MRLKERKGFVRTDLKDQDFTITYLHSGFEGQYLEVYEDAGYSIDVRYVSDSKILKQLDRRFKEKLVKK